LSPSGGSSAGSEGYRVGLSDAPGGEAEVLKRPVDRAAEGSKGKHKKAPGDQADRFEPAAPPAKRAKKAAGIEVRPTPGLMPKELRDDEISHFQGAPAGDRDGAAASENPSARHASGTSPPAASSPAPTPPGTANAPAQRVAPAAPEAELPRSVQRGASNDTKKAAKPAPVPAGAQNASPSRAAVTVAPNADPSNARDGRRLDKVGSSEAKPVTGEDRAGNSASEDQAARVLLAWARKQHDQVIALVGSSNCLAAANAAGEIYSRAPSYYAANIVTDRSIRRCLPYLNSERDRQDRSRAAAKRAVDDAVNTPADSRK
jgi:hypothetical protein